MTRAAMVRTSAEGSQVPVVEPTSGPRVVLVWRRDASVLHSALGMPRDHAT